MGKLYRGIAYIDIDKRLHRDILALYMYVYIYIYIISIYIYLIYAYKVVPPQLCLLVYHPMKTSSIYHQQKPVREIGVISSPQLSDFVAGGTTL